MNCVYGIFINGQDLPIYIGSGNTCRFKRPVKDIRMYNKDLIKFCSENEYTKQILFEVETIEQVRYLETYLIKVNHSSDVLHFNRRTKDSYLEKEFHPHFGKFGKDHPTYGQKHSQETKDKIGAQWNGMKHPLKKGYYITPSGKFESSRQASEIEGVTPTTILNRCKSTKQKWVDWIFEPKQ